MDTPQKRALVTGAAGGLGRTVAIMLAERGCCVALADRDAQGLEATARSIGTLGAESLSLACDLAADGAPARTISGVVAAWGGLDVLINNAGYGGIEPFFKMTEALWRKTLDINVVALAMLTSAAGAVMIGQRSGRIVNITSPASRMALPNYTAYAASKAAVDSITRAAAVALAPFGVLVNSVAPGMMDTEMQRRTEADLASLEGRTDRSSEFRRRLS